MMKTLAMIGAVLACLVAAPALGSDHGYVTGVGNQDPENGIFRVSIDKINGKNASVRPNHEVPAGKNTITVSLMYEPAMGTNLAGIRDMVYEAEFELDVEAGKTYEIGAKVDTGASEAAQADGSFWKPVVVKVK